MFVLASAAEEASLEVEVERADGSVDEPAFDAAAAELTVTLTDTALGEGDDVVVRYLPL